jgi:hypothetical protein
MARSVSTPSNTVYTEYNSCDFEDSYEFDMAVENLQDALRSAFPSVSACSEWLDREDRAIAENSYAYFGVSEYCGLVAVWCAAKDPDYYANGGFEALRDRWIDQIEGKFRAAARGSFGQALVQTARFSNGEAMFSAVGAPNQGELGLGYSSKEGWI